MTKFRDDFMILGHACLPRCPLLNLCSLVSVQREPGSPAGPDGGSAGAGVDLGALGPEMAVRTTGLCVRPQTLWWCKNPILSGFILLFLSLSPSRDHPGHHSFSSVSQEEVIKEAFPSHEILGD